MIASISPQELVELIDRNYRELAKLEMAGIRFQTEAEFDSAKDNAEDSDGTVGTPIWPARSVQFRVVHRRTPPRPQYEFC